MCKILLRGGVKNGFFLIVVWRLERYWEFSRSHILQVLLYYAFFKLFSISRGSVYYQSRGFFEDKIVLSRVVYILTKISLCFVKAERTSFIKSLIVYFLQINTVQDKIWRTQLELFIIYGIINLLVLHFKSDCLSWVRGEIFANLKICSFQCRGVADPLDKTL